MNAKWIYFDADCMCVCYGTQLDDTPTFVRSRILYSPSSPLSFIRFADTEKHI